MRRSVVELVVDLGSEDSEDVGFEGRFGNCVRGVRSGCLKEERRRAKKGSLSCSD